MRVKGRLTLASAEPPKSRSQQSEAERQRRLRTHSGAQHTGVSDTEDEGARQTRNQHALRSTPRLLLCARPPPPSRSPPPRTASATAPRPLPDPPSDREGGIGALHSELVSTAMDQGASEPAAKGTPAGERGLPIARMSGAVSFALPSLALTPVGMRESERESGSRLLAAAARDEIAGRRRGATEPHSLTPSSPHPQQNTRATTTPPSHAHTWRSRATQPPQPQPPPPPSLTAAVWRTKPSSPEPEAACSRRSLVCRIRAEERVSPVSVAFCADAVLCACAAFACAR